MTIFGPDEATTFVTVEESKLYHKHRYKIFHKRYSAKITPYTKTLLYTNFKLIHVQRRLLILGVVADIGDT